MSGGNYTEINETLNKFDWQNEFQDTYLTEKWNLFKNKIH